MYQLMIDNVSIGGKKPKPKSSYGEEDKRLTSLDVKARAAIANSLPYHIHHLVHNYESTHEMTETLTVAYEGTVEV